MITASNGCSFYFNRMCKFSLLGLLFRPISWIWPHWYFLNPLKKLQRSRQVLRTSDDSFVKCYHLSYHIGISSFSATLALLRQASVKHKHIQVIWSSAYSVERLRLLKTDIDSVHSIFQRYSAPSYLSTWLLESGIEALASKNILRFNYVFHDLTKDVIITISESIVAIKNVCFTHSRSYFTTVPFYRNPPLGFDASTV